VFKRNIQQEIVDHEVSNGIIKTENVDETDRINSHNQLAGEYDAVPRTDRLNTSGQGAIDRGISFLVNRQRTTARPPQARRAADGHPLLERPVVLFYAHLRGKQHRAILFFFSNI